jgi:hypothetical protein
MNHRRWLHPQVLVDVLMLPMARQDLLSNFDGYMGDRRPPHLFVWHEAQDQTLPAEQRARRELAGERRWYS